MKLYSRARQGVVMWCPVLSGVEYGDKFSVDTAYDMDNIID